MKLKEDFMLRNICGEWTIVPMGERLTEFTGMMKVNDTGAFIWKMLEKETTKEEIVTALLEEYDVDRETAECTLEDFVSVLEENKVLETVS